MAHEKNSLKQPQTLSRPRILSPVADPASPDAIKFEGAERFWRIFRGRNAGRSALTFRKNTSVQDLFEHLAEAKLRSDVDMGYDISVVPYPLGFNPEAWGVLTDRVGRLFAALPSSGDTVELRYQSGRCRSLRDWRELVESPNPEEQDQIRGFYNRIRLIADKRITVAGTAGFGLWDALWMVFGFDTSLEMLSRDPDFANIVFRHWKSFHLGAVSAMLDAGIKTILFRENSRGFSQVRGLSMRLNPFLKSCLAELSHAVHSRGGSLFLDCDADEMIETEYPTQWGFDGIGPLLFRDMEDLISARRSLNESLVLVGATLFPFMPGIMDAKDTHGKNLILAIANGSIPALDRKEISPGGFRHSKFWKGHDLASWIRTSAWHS